MAQEWSPSNATHPYQRISRSRGRDLVGMDPLDNPFSDGEHGAEAAEAAMRDAKQISHQEWGLSAPVMWRTELMRYVFSKEQEVEEAAHFLGLFGELFAMVTFVCAFLTFIYHPEVLSENPIRKAFGYSNLCTLFDHAPAIYVAVVAWPLLCACLMQFANLSARRIRLQLQTTSLTPRTRHGGWLPQAWIGAHYGTAFALCVMVLVFIFHPWDDLLSHTRPLLCFMFMRFASAVATAMENSWTGNSQSWLTLFFLTFYGVVTGVNILLAEACIPYSESQGEQMVPWYFPWFTDWSWVLCNILSSKFLHNPPVVVRGRLVTAESLAMMSLHKGLAQRFANGTRLAAGRSDIRKGITIKVLKAILIMDKTECLPAQFQCGLFAEKATFHAIVRINMTEHGAVRFSIRLQVPEAMEVLEECKTHVTHGTSDASGRTRGIDLLFAEGLKEFFTASPSTLNSVMELSTCNLFEALNMITRPREVWHELKAYKRTVENLNHAQGPCGKAFYGGLPFSIGQGAMKMGLRPRQDHPLPEDMCPGPGATEDAMCELNIKAMDEKLGSVRMGTSDPPEWAFVVQLARDDTCELNKGNSCWNEEASPYLEVGTFKLLAEECSLSEPSFSPWNQLKAHRPLGDLQCARYTVYQRCDEARARCPVQGVHAV